VVGFDLVVMFLTLLLALTQLSVNFLQKRVHHFILFHMLAKKFC